MGEQEVGNLQYINEGNVHIVLELSGTENVLRLIKEEEEKPTHLRDVQNSTKFVNVVMAPLLQEKANETKEIIKLSAERISQLSESLKDIRPVHRRFKSKLSPIAIKTLNLTLLSTQCHSNYCIEIKPKEGFIAPAFRSLHKCYYCLKQHLKLDSKQIQKRSDYCPLDLFSCERSRMKRALSCLVCNPQNNFKIFKDGKVIFNEHYNTQDFENVIKCMGVFSSINIYLDFIIDILMSSNNQNIILKETPVPETLERNQTCVENSKEICQLEENQVPFILKLLQIQKLSQSVDLDLSEIGHGKEYVQDLLDMLQKEKLDLHLKGDRNIFIKKANPLHLRMISAVAKDCSIMIAYSPEYIENYPFITTDNKKIPYRISLTDLEPKNMESLVRRRQTENKMIEAFNKYQENVTEGICLIQPHIETRTKQLEAWQHLITDYFKANKLSTLDVREAQNLPLFNNAAINRKLSQESLLIVLEAMSRSGRAAPLDKSKSVWEVYWHSLDEWGNMVYSWASNNGFTNAVCTLFELREGDNTVNEEFHGLDMNILTKALKTLEVKGKCELMEFDDNQGVKFF